MIRLDNLLGKQLLSNPENLCLEQTCFISKHQNFPLARVNPSINRAKPIHKDFPWQQWIKEAIAHQILLDLDPHHELNLAHNQLQLLLNHVRLHPAVSNEQLTSVFETLEQPELHSDLLIIKDNVHQLYEFRILTSAIEAHLAQLNLAHIALARQKKEIETHLRLYQRGNMSAKTFLSNTQHSINKISRLNSHEANWFKIILNTLIATAFTLLFLFCSFQTSIIVFASLLLLTMIAQLSPFF